MFIEANGKVPVGGGNKSVSCSMRPNCTIASRFWRSLAMGTLRLWYSTSRNPYKNKLFRAKWDNVRFRRS